MQTESLQELALTAAQIHSIEKVLSMVVEGLARQPQIALSRVWLREPDDTLRLVASAGTPLDKGEDWSRLDGAFCCFRSGERKIGHIGATGESLLIDEISEDDRRLARPEWAEREKILSFVGHPLIFREEILGVLAVFTRSQLDEHDLKWLRIFADHAAVAIANAHAFEEISELKQRLELENDYLKEEVKAACEICGIVGKSPALQKVRRQIELVAASDASVLIEGETGTGKELVARAIHERSPRRDRPMVRVNCGSIPQELFESEFFGHVRGAFTGAIKDRVGRFQLADGGTLFLDEVGEIPPALQSKLLRVLQEGEFERVGEDRTRRADVRVVAATNRNLRGEIDGGKFREDLYYRLSVFPLAIPPLRERREDIAPLAVHFTARSSRKLNREVAGLTERNINELEGYSWPGNVRELQNVIERAVILSQNKRLTFDLPVSQAAGKVQPERPTKDKQLPRDRVLTAGELKDLERDNLIRALGQGGDKVYGPGGAAELLGMKPTTLISKMKALGIQPTKS